jgi:hypothetical protein
MSEDPARRMREPSRVPSLPAVPWKKETMRPRNSGGIKLNSMYMAGRLPLVLRMLLEMRPYMATGRVKLPRRAPKRRK